MADQLEFRAAKMANKPPADRVFALEGVAQLGPVNSKSAEVIISFWDDSVSKPIFLSARYGLPADIESSLSSLEPVEARFQIDSRRGLKVVACQLPARNGKGWQAWETI